MTHFAVTSSGRKIEAPKFLRKAEQRLKRLQQALARKTKGSARHKKAVVRVAKAHAHVADSRRDFHHKLSTTLIRENQAVMVEDLCVVGLGRTRLAKSVHDAGWSQFVNMLEYKAARYGRDFVKVDRFFPSTRMCSRCGALGDKKPLHIREWTCVCGAHHDRDINAAINIRAEGRSDLNDRGARTRPAPVPVPRRAVRPASVPASRDEAVTPRKAAA